jgi:hypothetical protein
MGRCSLLILRGRPRRLPRKLSEADRTTLRQFAHQLATLRRDLETLKRTDQARRDDLTITSSLIAQVAEVQKAYRDVVATVRGMRAREVPGFDADAKQELIKNVNIVAEEFKDVRHLRAEVARLTNEVHADVDALRDQVRALARAVGEDAS